MLVGGPQHGIAPVDRLAQTGWAVVFGGQPRQQVLLKTEDGGKHWKEQPAPELEKAWYARARIWSIATGSAAGSTRPAGRCWTTTDGARSWQPVTLAKYENGPLVAEGKPLSSNFGHPGMYVFSFEHLILCGQAGAILETSDAGQDLESTTSPLGADFQKQMGV